MWGVVAKVIGKMRDLIMARAMMYKVVVQAVILYGSEIWVVTDAMMTFLDSLHHRTARRISGMTERRGDRSNGSGPQWMWQWR